MLRKCQCSPGANRCPDIIVFIYNESRADVHKVDSWCPGAYEEQTNYKASLSLRFSSVVQSCRLFATHGLQHARFPCPSPTPGAYSNLCPQSQWCHPTILSSVVPSSPAFNLSKHQGLFQWVSSSHQVAWPKGWSCQHQFFQWIFKTKETITKA